MADYRIALIPGDGIGQRSWQRASKPWTVLPPWIRI